MSQGQTLSASRSAEPVGGAAFAWGLWLIIGLGTAIRLIVAFTTHGQRYDLQSFALVNSALHAHVFGVYHQLDNFPFPPYGRWPYPPGFFAFIVPLASVARATGLAFSSLIRLPAVLADAGIAWLVQDYLGWRGHTRRQRLGAAALVSLGPSFAAISGYHGQIDSVAILPAVGAAYVWMRSRADWRAYAAGALIGAGAAIKTVPILMVLALLPSARSWREAARLIIPAVAIPVASFAPWLILDGPGKSLVWTYRGGPGLGGISLLSDPALPLTPFSGVHQTVHGLTKVVFDQARWITAAALVCMAGLLARYRPAAVLAASLLWLTVWVFGVTFFLQYLVWGLPFLLMAGYLRPVLALELAVLPATVISYTAGTAHWLVWLLYTAPMILFWLASVTGLVAVAHRVVRGRDPVALTSATELAS